MRVLDVRLKFEVKYFFGAVSKLLFHGDIYRSCANCGLKPVDAYINGHKK